MMRAPSASSNRITSTNRAFITACLLAVGVPGVDHLPGRLVHARQAQVDRSDCQACAGTRARSAFRRTGSDSSMACIRRPRERTNVGLRSRTSFQDRAGDGGCGPPARCSSTSAMTFSRASTIRFPRQLATRNITCAGPRSSSTRTNFSAEQNALRVGPRELGERDARHERDRQEASPDEAALDRDDDVRVEGGRAPSRRSRSYRASAR